MSDKRNVWIFYAFLLLSACSQTAENEVWKQANRNRSDTTARVVLLVIDGPRLIDTWASYQPTAAIPNQLRLAQEGVFFSNFYNEGDTYTLSGHTALLTGTYEKIKNNGHEWSGQPSIFQRYLAASRTSPTNACLITSKKKLGALGNCKDFHWRDSFLPSVHAADREDSVTLKLAQNTLRKDHPVLSLIHFRGPDKRGHAKDWEGYLAAIQETDRYVADLWEFIQTDTFYQDRTMLLVTNDHGRHLDGIGRGFVDHGDHCEGCRHIALLALGPGLSAGSIVGSHYEQIDIAPTIATLLNFPWQGEGHPIRELIYP